MTRRDILKSTAALAAPGLTGCGFLKKPLVCRAAAAPFPSAPELTIDAHCHIFNGTDLQAKEFVARVVLPEKGIGGELAGIVGDVLQGLAWKDAPTGKEELNVLNELKDCTGAEAAKRLDQHRERSYSRARTALRNTPAFRRHITQTSTSQSARSRLRVQRDPAAKPTPASVLDELDRLTTPPTFAGHRAERESGNARFRAQAIAPGSGGSSTGNITGVLDYIIQNFQYRYVTAQDYSAAFDSADRRVDLMMAAMVDYDWWLADGGPTPTSLDTQVQVMEQISVATGGRVHALAPYDPLRDVAFHMGLAPAGSLSLVQEAVSKRGAIGVKMYPPMGFAPFGNARLGAGFWGDSLIRQTLKDIPDLGKRLDNELARFYAWCVSEQVPVMAHSSRSNGIAPKFASLAGPEHWCPALEAFPSLRVSFGHFGDFADALADPSAAPDAAKLIALMGESGRGAHAYADTGYFSEVLADGNQLHDRFAWFLKSATAPPLAERLMYGTDWDMLLNAGNVNDYLNRFAALILSLEDGDKDGGRDGTGKTLSRGFFGYNAVDWAGLRKGGAARDRLDKFYAPYGIGTRRPRPDWMEKLDSATPGTRATS